MDIGHTTASQYVLLTIFDWVQNSSIIAPLLTPLLKWDVNIPFQGLHFQKDFTPLCLLCNFLQLVAYVIHDILTCLGNISRPFSLNCISDLNYEIILPR